MLKLKLNSKLRGDIINNALLKAGVVEENILLVEARAALCERVVSAELARVGETQETLRAWYNTLINAEETFIGIGLYTKSASPGSHTAVDVNLCGRRVFMYTNGAHKGATSTHITQGNTPHLKPVYEGGNFYPRGSVTITDANLSDEFDTLEARQQTNDEKAEAIRLQVGGVLRSVTTVKKLLEVWPEAKSLLPSEIEKTASTALTVPVEALNSLCNLG